MNAPTISLSCLKIESSCSNQQCATLSFWAPTLNLSSHTLHAPQAEPSRAKPRHELRDHSRAAARSSQTYISQCFFGGTIFLKKTKTLKTQKKKNKNKENNYNVSWKKQFPQEQSEGLGGPRHPRLSKTSPYRLREY